MRVIKNRFSSKLTRQRLSKFLSLHGTEELTLEVGANNRPYKNLFPCVIAGDIVYNPSIDIQFDAHTLPFADTMFNNILCTEVLEHCVDPHLVIREFYRILKPGGKLILTTRFLFPIHEAPHDYFRYTKYGLQRLCRSFNQVVITEEVATVETVGVLLQRLAYQVKWKMPLSRLVLHLLAQIVIRCQWLVSAEYGDIRRSVHEQNIMTSGYYLVAIK